LLWLKSKGKGWAMKAENKNGEINFCLPTSAFIWGHLYDPVQELHP
jgi:hypothetical protein